MSAFHTESRTIEYTFSEGDFVALTKAVCSTSLLQRWSLILLGPAFMFGLAAISLGSWDSVIAFAKDLLLLKEHWAFYPPLFAGVLLAVLQPELLAFRARWGYRLASVAGKRLTISLEDQGVHVSTGDARSQIDWTGFQGVTETPEHFFLRLGQREAIIVPARAFKAAEDFEDAAAFAQSHMHKASA